MNSLKRYIVLCMGLIWSNGLFAQATPAYNEKELAAMLASATSQLETSNFAIYFDGISYSLAQPTDIFTVPVYRVFRGGYYFYKNNQFEMNAGSMKAVSDGKVTVMIDEVGKQILIDSVIAPLKEDAKEEEYLSLIEKTMGFSGSVKTELIYKGKQKVKGKNCHVIQANAKGDNAQQQNVYYITEDDKRLILMADKQEKGYNVYWINRITEAPPKHSYKVFVPDKEMEQAHGYQITDMRFNK